MRHQSVNLVNQPMGFFIIYEFAKHILSDKIKARMTVSLGSESSNVHLLHVAIFSIVYNCMFVSSIVLTRR